MRQKHSDHIRREVKAVYNEIAKDFSGTRQQQWKEFQYFIDYIDHKIGKEKVKKIVDIGCGNGRLYQLLKDYKADYLGVDQSAGLIEQARLNFPTANFEVGDMIETRLASHDFDIIFSIAAFHHIPSKLLRQKTIDEMYRLLKPNGVLILTVWNLFQKKYFLYFIRSVMSFIFHLGLKYAWNDLWIKWANHPKRRYYHAFLPSEFISLFKKNQWIIEDFFYVKKGKKVSFWNCFNICIILKKKSE